PTPDLATDRAPPDAAPQGALQDVERRLRGVGAVEMRPYRPGARSSGRLRERDPARHQREEPVEVFEDRCGRFTEEQECDAHHRLYQRRPETPRACTAHLHRRVPAGYGEESRL